MGKSIDGKGYLPGCPVEPCCLSVKHDLVPDGDGGWSMITILLLALGGYLGGGVAYGKRRDSKGSRDRLAAYHPHYSQGMNLIGLCQDGVHFSRGLVQGGGDRRQRAPERSPPPPPMDEPLLSTRSEKSPNKEKEKKRKKDRKQQHHVEQESSSAVGNPDEASTLQVPAAAAEAAGPKSAASGGGGRWVHVEQ